MVDSNLLVFHSRRDVCEGRFIDIEVHRICIYRIESRVYLQCSSNLLDSSGDNTTLFP